MSKIAVIGGSGFYCLPGLNNMREEYVSTRYGADVRLNVGQINGGQNKQQEVVFLARHGVDHRIPPHKINYRANIDALSQLGVSNIIAINAVGSMHNAMSPGTVVLPDQLVDYTWGRDHTFFDEFADDMVHVDFTDPLCSEFRFPLYHNLSRYLPTLNSGTYACVQGPRLETAAEIRRFKNDGCDLVGMTLMPESALAREKQIHYISVCVVCNWAAGIEKVLDKHMVERDSGDSNLNIDDIKAVLADSLTKVQKALADTLTFS